MKNNDVATNHKSKNNAEIRLEEVTARIKEKKGLRFINDVAKELGFQKNAFLARLKNNSIPFEEIYWWAKANNLNFEFLLTGKEWAREEWENALINKFKNAGEKDKLLVNTILGIESKAPVSRTEERGTGVKEFLENVHFEHELMQQVLGDEGNSLYYNNREFLNRTANAIHKLLNFWDAIRQPLVTFDEARKFKDLLNSYKLFYDYHKNDMQKHKKTLDVGHIRIRVNEAIERFPNLDSRGSVYEKIG